MFDESLFERFNGYFLTSISLLFLLITMILIYLKYFNLLLLGSYIILSWIIFLFIYKYIKTDVIYTNTIKYDLITYFIYPFLYIISLLILFVYEIRPIQYFLIISIMFLIIFYDIYSSSINKHSIYILVILVFIGFLFLNVVYSVNLKYFFYFGSKDIFSHVKYIDTIIISSKIDFLSTYEDFPLWHILCAVFTLLTQINLGTEKTMFIINGIVYFTVIILLYYLFQIITKNQKISLLSCLIFASNMDALSNGMYSIPRSGLFIFEITFLIFLLKRLNIQNAIMLILNIIVIVIFHPASIPFIFMIIIILSITQKITKSTLYIPHKIIYFIILFTCTYWMFKSGFMFTTFIKKIFLVDITGGAIGGVSAFTTPFNEFLNYLQFVPLLILVYIAFFKGMLIKEINKNTKSIILFTPVLLVFSIPGPVDLISKLARSFNIGRLGFYSLPFICLMAGTGLYILAGQKSRKIKIFTIILMFSYNFLTITSDFIASDNPLFKRDQYTQYLSENEYKTILDIGHFSNGTLYSDHSTVRFLRSLNIESITMKYTNETLEVKNNEILIIRYAELQNRNLQVSPEKNEHLTIFVYVGKNMFNNVLNNNDIIFNSKDVISCFIITKNR